MTDPADTYEALATAPQPPAEAQAQGGGEAVAEVCEDQSGSKYLCWNPRLTPLPPAGTRLYTAPPSAPVGVEGLMQLARNWCLAWGEWAHDADPGCAKENAAEAALRAALTTALAQQPAAVDGAMELLWGIRDFLWSLPKDCMGSDTDSSGQPYPIRDEVIDTITKQLAAPRPPAEAQRCTCPSGDGSLRWPCPAPPAEAQAQGGGVVVAEVCEDQSGS